MQEVAALGKYASSLCRVSNAMIAAMQSMQRSLGRMDVVEMIESVRGEGEGGGRDDVSERNLLSISAK